MGFEPEVTLSDLYPNIGAFERTRARVAGIEYSRVPVDATAVDPEQPGFRTLFESFHHFPPAIARAILQDAVRCRRGIGIFELTERSLWSMALIAGAPLVALATTPFLRPARAGRLFWTYALPVVPAVLGIDGIVSCLRTYSPAELRDLVDSLDGPDYHWDIGRTFAGRLPLRVTYAIGVPR